MPPADVDALRQALLKLYHNLELADQMGAMGCLRYEKYFTAERMGKKYVEIYEKILEPVQNPTIAAKKQ